MEKEPNVDRDLLDLFSGLIEQDAERMILQILLSTQDEEDALDKIVVALEEWKHDKD